jgi:acetyltransferase-like isoleucine patch superfamily enzyme
MPGIVKRTWFRLLSAWKTKGSLGVLAEVRHAAFALRQLLADVWVRGWMRFAGLGFFGRMATRLAVLFMPPFSERARLAWMTPRGYVAPSATIYHSDFQRGPRVFIGERVLIFQDKGGGAVRLAESVHLYDDISILTIAGGSIEIGGRTRIQPRCQFTAAVSPIRIGRNVEIAPNCAFYPYDHGIEPGTLISEQPLKTKGGISVEDGAWLGFGVIVLDGVRIGKGAVVGAGSVVMHDVPDGAVAFGVPARVVKMRG